MRGCDGAAGTERRNARAKEHSPGHLGGIAERGLPGREPGMGGPGELQCYSDLMMLQREENQEKTSLGKC